jgi:hypothetical protein
MAVLSDECIFREGRFIGGGILAPMTVPILKAATSTVQQVGLEVGNLGC